MSNAVVIQTTKGLQAPVRSLTDSMMLPEGSLLKAKNCTFLPAKTLALWRPLFVEKTTLVENPGNETVIAACYDCDYLGFITADGTTYRYYLYKTSNMVQASPKYTVTVDNGDEDASVTFCAGYCVFAVENQSIVLVSLEDGSVWHAGSVLYTEAAHGENIEYTLPATEVDLGTVKITKSTKLAYITYFFARSNPDIFGVGILKLYTSSTLQSGSLPADATLIARSANVLYLGSLPDMESMQPTGDAVFYPMTFELLEDTPVEENKYLYLRLEIQGYSGSGGDDRLLIEACDEVHYFLAEGTGTNPEGKNPHFHINGTHHPKGTFCASGMGRYFVGQTGGTVFSSDVLCPFVFDGYVTTGLELTGLAVYKQQVIAFSGKQCSVIAGVWPDMLEGITEKHIGVSTHQAILPIEDVLFLSNGGILSSFENPYLQNAFLAEPTIKSYLTYYERLHLLIISLINEGVHVAIQLNGLLTTTWILSEVGDDVCIIQICGDYALTTDGVWRELQFETGNDNYEVEVLTRAINCGTIKHFDRLLTLSGCDGPGKVTLLYACDCIDIDNWTTDSAQTPYSQWEEVSFTFDSVSPQDASESAVSFGDGLATALDTVASFYRHPVHCISLKDQPSGWAAAVCLQLDTTAKKSHGTLLGGFILSFRDEIERIGFVPETTTTGDGGESGSGGEGGGGGEPGGEGGGGEGGEGGF